MPIFRSATPNIRESFSKARFPGKVAIVFGSCFGLGIVPVAQGTLGALAAVPFALIWPKTGFAASALLLLLIVLAVIAAEWSSRALGREDPAEVIIDEAAGLLLTLFLVPVSWLSMTVGFFLFRFFDIVKPFPIRKMERLRGGFGIVFDDFLAGIYANLCLRFILWLMG